MAGAVLDGAVLEAPATGGAAHPTVASRWAPLSACTPDCLPSDDGPHRGPLLVAARMVALAVVLLGTVGGVPLLAGAVRERWLRTCSRAVLRAAGVRLQVTGDVPFLAGPGPDGGGVLVVANHTSWIDVLALDAVQPVRMLAKHEVRDWPVIGGLAARTGALFVDRAGLRALPATVAETADALRAGSVVGVFPEGTTWCGAATGSFRRAAFQAAVDAGVPVRPVALTFRRADGSVARTAAFVGDQTLLDSLRRVLRTPGLVCRLTVLPAIASAGLDRRELAHLAAVAVGAVTGAPHLDGGTSTAATPAGESRESLPAAA